MKHKKVKTKKSKNLKKKSIHPVRMSLKIIKKSKVAKAKKVKTAKPKKEIGIVTNFKFKPSDKAAMKKLAAQYTKGNLTKWLQMSGLNYRPAK